MANPIPNGSAWRVTAVAVSLLFSVITTWTITKAQAVDDSLDRHKETIGHPALVERVNAFQNLLESIEDRVIAIDDRLREQGR